MERANLSQTDPKPAIDPSMGLDADSVAESQAFVDSMFPELDPADKRKMFKAKIKIEPEFKQRKLGINGVLSMKIKESCSDIDDLWNNRHLHIYD